MGSIMSKLYIYGMGRMGIRTYMMLKEKKYKISNFIDVAPEKQGCCIDGVKCMSLEKLQNDINKEDQIIVALENAMQVIDSLKKMGLKKVINYKELPDEINIQYEPINDMDMLGKIYDDILKQCR